MMFTFPDRIFQTLQTLEAMLDKSSLDKVSPNEAAVIDFPRWMTGPEASQMQCNVQQHNCNDNERCKNKSQYYAAD